MFKETLRELVEGTEGGLAGLLMDSSGITLESYAKDDSPFDINSIGIEFGVVIGQIKRAAEMLEAGAGPNDDFGRQAPEEAVAILLRDYGVNLSLLLGMTAAVALVLFALRVLRDQRPADAPPEAEAD